VKKRPNREAVIEAVLADLRRHLESELPDENATLEQIEDVAHRISLEFERGLQQRLVIASQHGAPEWLPEAEEALRQLTGLPQNWDSYGARPIQPLVVQSAIDLLRKIARADMPRPAVVPTVRGGVQLEWHARGIDLEVEFTSPEKIHVLYEDVQEEDEWELELGLGWERVAGLTARLSRAQ
jgi:hypothetical protein